MKINNILIGKKNAPFIIGEISSNHNQSLETMMNMLELSKKIGLKVIKIQTYKHNTITLNSNRKEFIIDKEHKLWGGKRLYDLYKQAHTPWEWHKIIFDKCKRLGLTCFSSPFDESAVDLLEKLNAPAYKIASFEITHIPLLKKVGKTKKPVILSTGMATKKEIIEAIETLKEAGCKNFAILKCTSTYPAKPRDSNIITIPEMIKEFKCNVGISDHTPGIGVSIAAISLGATIIEKHITLSKDSDAVDSKFSLDFKEFKNLIIESKRAWNSIGKISYGPTKNEKSSIINRRSIYVTKNLKKGDKITKNNIKVVRPNLGEKPKYYDYFIGKKVKKNFIKNTPIKKENVY